MAFNGYSLKQNESAYVGRLRTYRKPLSLALEEANEPLSKMERRVKRKVEARGLTWAKGRTIGAIFKKVDEVEVEE